MTTSTRQPAIVPELRPRDEIRDLDGVRYTVGKRIGEGGLGRVYIAMDEVGGTKVAIKVPLTYRYAAELLAEARWTFRSTARHTCGVTAIGMHEWPSAEMGGFAGCPIPFVVMPFFGDTLSHAIRGPAVPIGVVVDWIIQSCVALEDLRVIHRDLKPENILMDGHQDGNLPMPLRKPRQGKDGQQRVHDGGPQVAHVTDFGLAVPADPEIRARSNIHVGEAPCGTCDYMSPEQFAGERNLTVASDVFALGMILHELVSRRPAREGDYESFGEAMQFLLANGFGPTVPGRVAHAELRQVIADATAVSRAKRIRTPAELAARLEPFRAETGMTAIGDAHSTY